VVTGKQRSQVVSSGGLDAGSAENVTYWGVFFCSGGFQETYRTGVDQGGARRRTRDPDFFETIKGVGVVADIKVCAGPTEKIKTYEVYEK
jgi:hypothetical protein